MFYVYLLIDPRTEQPFYVGKGSGNRHKAHFNGKARNANKFKDNVIAKIRAANLTPRSEIVFETIRESEAFAKEAELIAFYGRRSASKTGILTNLSDGGEGQTGYRHTQESKQKMSESNKGEKNGFFGKTHTTETKKKMVENREYIVSDEQKAKLSAALKGRPKHAGHGAKVRAALKGKKKSPEHVEKMAATKRGTHHSDETKKKISMARKGRPKSPETRERMRQAALKRKRGENGGFV